MQKIWQPKTSLILALTATILFFLWAGKKQITAAPVDIISNGSFSDGLTAWALFVDPSAQMNPTVVNGELAVDVIAPGSETYHLMVRQPYLPIVNGSTYTLSFAARASQDRSLLAKVGLISSPYTSYGLTTVDLTTQMQTFTHTFTMAETSDACAILEFQVGANTADVVIDNVSLITEDTAVVPPPDGEYITPSVTGHPLRYHADQQNMVIGSASDMNELLCDAAHSAILSTEFNSITPGNAMKMGPLQPVQGQYQFGDADAVVDFAQAYNMQVHGHVLVWHNQLPGWVQSGSFSRQELIDVMYDHIDTVMGRYQGQITVWDIVNEAIDDSGQLRNSIWRTTIGDDYIDLAFQRARQADPNAALLYNDYNIGDLSNKSNVAYNLIADMVSRGIPIDGVGFQMHWLESSPPNPNAVAANMARYADLGVDVYITEMDVRIQEPADTSELADQADIYRSMMDVCLAAPNCHSFTTWGLSDKYSWIPGTFPGYGSAHLFDDAFNAKPAYHALIDVLAGGAPTPTATNPGSTPTPTNVPGTATPTPPGTGACAVTYTVANQWGSGMTVNVNITNNSSTSIQGWTLTWTHAPGQAVSSGWNVTISQSGNAVTASNAASNWNGVIAANGGTATFGFNGTHTGVVQIPTDFALNGTACNQGTPSPTETPTTTTPANLPDLVVTDITYNPGTPQCGTHPPDLGARVWIENAGTAAAGTFVVTVNGVSQQTISGLAAGQETSIVFGGILSEVTAVADATNLIAESDETNNSLTRLLPVPTLPPTCTPTPSTTPDITNTPTPTFTPTFTPTPTLTPTPGSGGACVVRYDLVNQWGDGFQANITITNNNSTPITGYTLVWDFTAGEQFTSGWNATYNQSSSTMSASNNAAHWNGTIGANGGSVSFGFLGSHQGTTVVPTVFTLNGQTCE